MTMIFKGRFEDKVMIITGASRGIGKATAKRAAAEGAKVVLVDIRAEQGEEVLREITESGGEGIFLNLDISKQENADRMVEETVQHFGKLDIAVNNAGVMGNPSPLHNLKKEDMDYTMANNFYSVYFCCKSELSQFLSQGTGGVIVNNASIAGVTGLPGNPAYVSSKHAVNGLTKNLALDYARYGIRVNSVNPAGTATPMVEEAYAFVMKKQKEALDAGLDPKKAQSMAGQKTKTMQEREATAEEQAASISFMVSEDATHMTGAVVQTDGGWTSF